MIFNTGGEYSLFEKDYKTKLKPLLLKLNKQEQLLHAHLLRSIKSGNSTSIYWDKVRRDIRIIYAEMSKIFDSWSMAFIPKRYEMSLKQIYYKISSSSIIDTSSKTLISLLKTDPVSQTMKLLYMDATSQYNAALTVGQGRILRFTRLTQQTLLNETLLSQTVAEGVIAGNIQIAADSISGSLWSKLAEGVNNLQFVQAGKYKYKPNYYAEMVSRVKFHEAHSYAALHQAINYGTDLVQVSSHNTITPICIPFEGKIYSVSGRSNLFPPLFDTPPYHPNCLHLLYPTFISGMEAEGTLDAYSEFSLGNTFAPPVPANFVPLNLRSME